MGGAAGDTASHIEYNGLAILLLGVLAVAIRADDVDFARDRSLVEMAQGGDESAFADLYQRYHRRLYRYCLRRVGNSHDAEEVVQETFVRAVTALPQFAGERRFYPWLTVIASRLCVDTHRRHARSEPTADIDLGSFDAEHDRRLVEDEDRQLVFQALDRLGPRHREVLRLREEQGLSYQAIADRYEVSIGTVEALLWRARKALKREYLAVAGADARLAGLPLVSWVARRWMTMRAKLETAAHGIPLVAGGAAAGVAIVGGLMLPGGGEANTQVREVNMPATATALTVGAVDVSGPDGVAPSVVAAPVSDAPSAAAAKVRVGNVVLSGDEADRGWAENAPLSLDVPMVGTVGIDPTPATKAIETPTP